MTDGRRSLALRLVFDLLARRALQHAEIVQLMVRELLRHPAALAENQEQSRGLVELVAVLVRRGQSRGEFRRGVDPTLAAAVLVVSYLAIVGEWVRQRGRLDLPDAVTQALDLVLTGLRRPLPRRA